MFSAALWLDTVICSVATSSSSPHRHIQSFVRREGRLTRGQQQALATLSVKYCLPAREEPGDVRSMFQNPAAPLHIEIGCGTGETLLALATLHPETNYLGFEVYRPGIGSLLLQLEKSGLTNVRLLVQDVVGVMEHTLATVSVESVYILFPDPWPKKRHHKRRLIQPAFVEQLRSKLSSTGTVFVATDDTDYALAIQNTFESARFRNLAGTGNFCSRPDWRPLTRFERRGLRLGHTVFDLAFTLLSTSPAPGKIR
jgi:tRNA (guanine-N7-)-methyltransferase